MPTGFSDSELAAALPYGGWRPPVEIQPAQQPLFSIPIPTPTTNYLGRGRSGSSQYSQLSQYQKLRQDQEAQFQAQSLAQQMAGVDPFQDDYPYKRFEAIQRFPLAVRAPEGAARIQAFDTAHQQAASMKKQADAEIQAAQAGQFVQAMINAETAEELDALASENPNLAAKYNTILNQRAKKFAPPSRDPDRDMNYWMEQEQQALRILNPATLASPDEVEAAKRQLQLVRSKFAPQQGTAAAPGALSAPASVNVKYARQITRPSP